MSLDITPIKDNNINDGLIDGRLPQHPFFMSLISPRGGGKTTFLLNLIMKKQMYYKYFHKIYIFSPTQYSDEKMMKAISIDDSQRYTYYDDDILGEIIEEQMINNEEVDTPKDRRRILFIFDDMIEELPTKKGNFFNKLASNGRHIYASVIVASQKYKKLSPIIRNNTKHWIIFDVQNAKELQDIYEEQAGKISKKAFFEMFEFATSGNHNFLYIKNDAPKTERFRRNFTDIIKIS